MISQQPTTVSSQTNSQDKLVNLIFEQDSIDWKDVIYRLVQEEGMNPWDIDVSKLSTRFLQMLETLKEADFRIGGKMVLASSLLLKIKSDRLLLEDIQNLDKLLQEPQDEQEDILEDDSGFEFEQSGLNQFLNDEKKLVPRTPQPRERKVSVFDLVSALEQALESDVSRKKRVLSQQNNEPSFDNRAKSFDINEAMDSMQKNLKKLFLKKTTTVFFNDLLTSNNGKEIVYTFLPLLHLENQRKVDLQQQKHFGPIKVLMNNRKLLE
ncbi:MAG: segregation/condensation protein A [Nanobdellota archaeon]